MNAIPPDRLSNRPHGVAVRHIFLGIRIKTSRHDIASSSSTDGGLEQNFVNKARISAYEHFKNQNYISRKTYGFSRNWLGQEVRPATNNSTKVKEYIKWH